MGYHPGLSCCSWRALQSVWPTGFCYAQLKNLPGTAPQSFWTGNMVPFYQREGWDFQMEVAQNYGPVVNIHGFLWEPTLYVYDPKALHSIIIKDQSNYEESSLFLQSNLLTFGPALISTLGNPHRKQRRLLGVSFSTHHLREMLPIFYEVASRLCSGIASRVDDGPKDIDMLGWMVRTSLETIGWMVRTSLETIGQGGFGYSFDSLTEDQAGEFGNALRHFVPTMFSLGIIRFAIPFVVTRGSASFRRWVLDMIPSKRVQNVKQAVDVIHKKSVEVLRSKTSALQSGDDALLQRVGEGKDLMSILLRANMIATAEHDRLSEDELLAQVSSLSFAATDTTSNTLARILHLLAQHPDVQQRLREEILESRNGGVVLSYDELMKLPYLDAVCRETLRVHPPATFWLASALKDTILPLSQPIRGTDGKMMGKLLVPKNTKIYIGVAGCNMNKALWGEDALEWKPERWLSPLPSAVSDAHMPGVYSNIMSFLGGGRGCIGFKFSVLEMKVILSTLLSHFRFALNGQPIVWNMSAVRYPAVSIESPKAEMPLKVMKYT
ncbi:Docosahexaenoic acid omega-hydroxylase CYP4F3 [Sparassis crispa]|uniref:Docosahexaenoic acid omega-hydroxylase CYP4F3 n=1 Tax=Sparassis crispa TaxID=139825 RepID=A0A401GK54_9APHY|nr:Docosahexaenoic acid omega-hydroxylase CYP4F3 [Sparassis crispa]GBE82529.1 Docosahexaenoic acid omega-hydroxylase CYP4F3 [Sparassis crispa]